MPCIQCYSMLTSRHSPGQPLPSTGSRAAMLPRHRPFIKPLPVVTLTFSSSVKFAIWRVSEINRVSVYGIEKDIYRNIVHCNPVNDDIGR
jgi:hypothetical protein